jgi:Mrp family chromosome partitioning ATPase
VPAAKPETVIALGPPPEAPKPKPAYEPAPAKIAEAAKPKPEVPVAPVVSEPKVKPAAVGKAEPAITAATAAVAAAASAASAASTTKPAPAVQAPAAAATSFQSPAKPAEAKDVKPAPSPAAAVASSEASKGDMKAAPSAATMASGEQPATAGLLDRLRQGLSAGQAEAKKEEVAPAPGLLARLRRALPRIDEATEEAKPAKGASVDKPGETIPPLKANDLRHYLNQRIAAATRTRLEEPVEKVSLSAPKVGKDKVGPALKSLDAVINHILASSKGGAPRAVLVAGVTEEVDATQEAIKIARNLVARREQVVLVDLTRGSTAVSGPLGLPRAPGFTDLAAGRASFDEVIRVDTDTPLQVITAGNPAAKGNGHEVDRFMRVFEALTEAYDCVVLHADGDSVRKLSPALKFELPIAVVVLPRGASAESEESEIGDFARLGCQVVVYEKTAKDGRTGLLGRVAAI